MLSCHSLKWVPNIWELRQVSAPIFLLLTFSNFQQNSHILVGILQINFNISFSEHFHILWRNCHFFICFFRLKRHSQKKLPFHSRSLCNCFSWCVAQICRFSARLLFLTTLWEIYLYSGRTHTAKWFGGNAVFWVIDSKAISFVGNKLVRDWNLILKKCNRVFSFFGWPVLFGHYMKMWIWSKTLNRNHCV